ncbi:MAG: hypothetical protein CFE24_04005 [Flavobacterium sp. BFFFF2]|nr:MAG: hypothetical protein CFE24_04005 [Flavobacterium sp. BFFFF2]
MYFIQLTHNFLAAIALAFILAAVVNSFKGKSEGRVFTAKDRKIALFALITTHLQLVIGLILYFMSPKGFAAMHEMKNAALRLTALEHPLTNIIAVTLITIGWSTHKKASTDAAKFGKISMFYLIGLLLILSRMPWNLWFNFN